MLSDPVGKPGAILAICSLRHLQVILNSFISRAIWFLRHFRCLNGFSRGVPFHPDKSSQKKSLRKSGPALTEGAGCESRCWAGPTASNSRSPRRGARIANRRAGETSGKQCLCSVRDLVTKPCFFCVCVCVCVCFLFIIIIILLFVYNYYYFLGEHRCFLGDDSRLSLVWWFDLDPSVPNPNSASREGFKAPSHHSNPLGGKLSMGNHVISGVDLGYILRILPGTKVKQTIKYTFYTWA